MLYQLFLLILLTERKGDVCLFRVEPYCLARISRFFLPTFEAFPLLPCFVQGSQLFLFGLQVLVERAQLHLELVDGLGLAQFFQLRLELLLLRIVGTEFRLVLGKVSVPLAFFLGLLQVDRRLELLALRLELLVLLGNGERRPKPF